MSLNFPKILIADDDAEDLELVKEAIREANPHAVLQQVTNGFDVLNYLRELSDDELPCLIVLDFNMPELNGSEVLQLISKEPRYKEIPKVMLSTSGAPLHVVECKKQGAAEYFVKPNDLPGLQLLAKKLLGFCC